MKLTPASSHGPAGGKLPPVFPMSYDQRLEVWKKLGPLEQRYINLKQYGMSDEAIAFSPRWEGGRSISNVEKIGTRAMQKLRDAGWSFVVETEGSKAATFKGFADSLCVGESTGTFPEFKPLRERRSRGR